VTSCGSQVTRDRSLRVADPSNFSPLTPLSSHVVVGCLLLCSFVDRTSTGVYLSPPSLSLLYCPYRSLLTVERELDTVPKRPFKIHFVNGLGGATHAPAGVEVDLSGRCLAEAVTAKATTAGHMRTGTAAEAMKGPQLIFDGVAGRPIKRAEVGVASGALGVERRVQETLPEEARGPLCAAGAEKKTARRLAPLRADAGSAPSAVEPFAGMEAGKCFVGKRDVGAVGTSRFGLGAKSAAEQAAAEREVNSGAVARFDNAEIGPSKAKAFGRAQPAKPQEQVREPGEGQGVAGEEASGGQVLLVEGVVQVPDVAIKERNRGASLVADAGPHAGGMQGVSKTVSRAAGLFDHALVIVHEGRTGAGNHEVPGQEL
jgi:hypothetical protein